MHTLLATVLGVVALAEGSAMGQGPAPSQALTSSLNASQITKGLRLSRREIGRSDNGRKRVRWTIRELETFEIIGNDQADADVVAWQCGSYDKAGNFLRPVPPDSFCSKFFTSVLANLVSSPNLVTSTLLHQTHENSGEVQKRIGNFSIETDGQFFFIRRLSNVK